MTRTRLYLDHNATSPLRPEARAAMLDALDHDGNASSVHGEGRGQRPRIEDARQRVAALVGARPADVVWRVVVHAAVGAIIERWPRHTARRGLVPGPGGRGARSCATGRRHGAGSCAHLFLIA